MTSGFCCPQANTLCNTSQKVKFKSKKETQKKAKENLFISVFILLTRRKAMEMLIHRVDNYPDLLPGMPRYCCLLVI